MQPNTKQTVLAVDIGGTKIIAALVSPQGEIVAQEYTPTLAKKGVNVVVRNIFTVIGTLLHKADITFFQIEGIGIAAAGALDIERGIVTASPNLPSWHDIPLRNIIEGQLGLKTFLINDANAAALGEHRYGAGVGVKNLVYVTVSTGIGGGIIIDSQLYSGASGSAGEIGHMTIDINGPRCNCGNIGCWEVLASGTAVTREAIRRINQGAKTSILQLVNNNLEKVTAQIVSLAAQRGDYLALEIVSHAATYLGVGLVDLVNIFNPEMIIIGGGMAKMGEMLLEPARQIVKERAFPISAQAVRIVPAKLGGNAGIIGAAAFVTDCLSASSPGLLGS